MCSCVFLSRQKVKSAGVWMSIASTYTWPLPPAKSASRPSSSCTRPLPNLSTCTPTCQCVLEGRVILVMRGPQNRPPTCPRGSEGLGKWFKCVLSAPVSKRHRTKCCRRDLEETVCTGAFWGLWPMHSYWTLACTGRQLLPIIIDLNMYFQKLFGLQCLYLYSQIKSLYCPDFPSVYKHTLFFSSPVIH